MPARERPRERILRHGAGSLSENELMVLLLRTGSRSCPVIELSGRVLRECGGLAGLKGLEADRLLRLGLGPARTAGLLAAVELGRRMARAQLPLRDPLLRPAAVVSYLAMRYWRLDQEVMGALYLDVRNRLLSDMELFRGTLNRTAVEPRPILRQGLLQGAAGVVLFHTHPSGDPSPSAEDVAFSRRLAEAAEVVGLRLLDHLVVGAAERWVSLKQRGVW
jgi:DNA repair protein RadC